MMDCSTATSVGVVPARYWSRLEDGRLQCDLCPRACRLHDGQRGLCFVRARQGDQLVLTTYGRSSGFCVDPIEKKPLNHFLPGSAVLSFGTAGCNLSCKFCQNWDISKSREMNTLADAASPERIARAARDLGCRSVAFTYNDSVQELEEMTQWIAENLGLDVPIHFTAFHPDWKMLDRSPTPPITLAKARRIARRNGLRYACTGNVHDREGGSTYCHACGALLVGRDWFELTAWNVTADARCARCNTPCSGVFDGPPGRWGARRAPVRLATFPR